MRLSFPLLLALLPAGLAAQQPAATAPRPVAGCYTLDLGPWSPALRASPVHTLPARVVLDTAAAAGARGSFRVLAASGVADTHETALWSPLPFKPDSLRIRWVT
ncbi:MAG TPA: hypothetical protein VGR37_19310, partial [Longimicrobiaceae bacterium]|nr:hypothetical protein [Longimicrobiaceae bacterium]